MDGARTDTAAAPEILRLAEEDRRRLVDLMEASEPWLMERILAYAHRTGYTRYTSTLTEPWRMSIEGLTRTLADAAERLDHVPDIGPDDDYVNDPAAAFGVQEARVHRRRGVNLGMFLGLMKYYRDAYHDLVNTARFDDPNAVHAFIARIFDRTELGYCTEWAGTDAEEQIRELASSTRDQTNEKTKLLTVFESLPSPALLVRPDSSVDVMNHAAAALFAPGAPAGASYYHRDAAPLHLPWLDDLLGPLGQDDRMTVERELEVAGGTREYLVLVAPMLDVSSKFQGRTVFMADVTESRRAERRLREAATVFESTTDGVMVTAPDESIVAVNRAFTTITGYTPEEAVGRTPRILASGRHDAAFYGEMWRKIREEGRWRGEVVNRRRDGSTYPELLTITAVRDSSGEVTRYVGVFSDISRAKEQALLEHLAHHDPLTDLPNRTLLSERLGRAMERGRRTGSCVAVLFVDLDGFKGVNDRLGHAAGDVLLRRVAQRMSAALRRVDTIARVGGDEFVVLIEDLVTPGQALPVAQKILDGFSAPFPVEMEAVALTASVGIATTVDPGASAPDILISRADQAMYRAKAEGRNQVRTWGPGPPEES